MEEVLVQAADSAPRGRRPGGGREAKRAARTARSSHSVPYITRRIPYYEVLDEEGLQTIERNADTILEETGIDFRDDPEALELFRAAGADVKGERVRFPSGMARQLVQRRHQANSRNLHATRPVMSSSAARIRCLHRPTAPRSCAIWTRAGATRRSRIFATS